AGDDIRFRSLQMAPTVPGTYPVIVNHTAIDLAGNPFSSSFSYTLIVPAPTAEINVYPILAEDICTDITDLATCGVAPTTTPNTLTLAPGEAIYLEFRINNTGQVAMTNNDWDDSEYGLVFDDNGTNINPGADIRFRSLQNAPTVPGTYPITVTYTGMDDFGNELTLSEDYTLFVSCPPIDNVAPLALCQDLNVTQLDDTDFIFSTADIDNGSADGCGSITLSLDQTQVNCG
ncbi:MAG: hypothetical protein AAFQ37_15375, partial [Bacteroidota bacterium]